MAHGVEVLSRSYAPNADLSSSQYLGIVIGSNGKAAVAGAGAMIVGVLQNKPKTTDTAAVRVSGLTKMVAGGTVTAGDKIMVNASGQAALATTGNYVIGLAEESGVVNQVISVLLMPSGKV